MVKQAFKTIVFLMIAIILVAGIVSCGGADITGSYSRENTGEDTSGGGNNTNPGGDNTNPGGNTNPGDDSTTKWDQSFYYRIRVPFAVGGDGYTNVSYADTNALKQLWLDQINRKAVNDGKVFAIRNRSNDGDANSFQKRRSHGQYSAYDYYYFNENGDIVWKEDNTIIKKFVGAIITGYRDVSKEMGRKYGFFNNTLNIKKYTWTEKGIYTVGGIYSMTMTTEEARSKYASGDDVLRDGVFDFVASRYQLEAYHDGWTLKNNLFERQYITPGFIEVLVMYDYDNWGYSGAASVHSYFPYYGHDNVTTGFTSENMPYMTNHNIYLGQRPEYTVTKLTHSTAFSDYNRWWAFLFMPGEKDANTTGARRINRRITMKF